MYLPSVIESIVLNLKISEYRTAFPAEKSLLFLHYPLAVCRFEGVSSLRVQTAWHDGERGTCGYIGKITKNQAERA